MGEILLICGVGPFVGGFVADLLFGTKGRWWRWYYAPLVVGIPGSILCAFVAVAAVAGVDSGDLSGDLTLVGVLFFIKPVLRSLASRGGREWCGAAAVGSVGGATGNHAPLPLTAGQPHALAVGAALVSARLQVGLSAATKKPPEASANESTLTGTARSLSERTSSGGSPWHAPVSAAIASASRMAAGADAAAHHGRRP